MQYKIFFKKSVRKDLTRIRKEDLAEILKKIGKLEENPRPHGTKKMTGQERYRLRHGCYRIIYSIQGDELTVWVVKAGHRRDVYR